MANAVQYKETSLTIGDTVAVDYKIKESDNKERIQQFSGIIIKIKGDSDATRMITVRKIAKSGTGVERIFPLSSPFIDTITVQKRSDYTKARAYFIRDLSNKKMRHKLYRNSDKTESAQKKATKPASKKEVVEEPTTEETITE
ncbi:MAG TPA: 50S ribosomal protein L19 [Candidatus Woesebacteria bacterium]|nr:50S ribosomal protein L19 [Candidatus Woesebacteria bacterium]